jgi:hypothetical protein
MNNKKAFEYWLLEELESEMGKTIRCNTMTTIQKLLSEFTWLAACEFKDKLNSYMSATQCVHQEALDVEEGFDGVICRKHLKILELEDQVKNKSEYIFKLKEELRGVNPFTGCKCKLYEETARVNLENSLKKAEERRDWLQGEFNKLTKATEEIMYQFKRYTESSSEDVKSDIKNKYFPMSTL